MRKFDPPLQARLDESPKDPPMTTQDLVFCLGGLLVTYGAICLIIWGVARAIDAGNWSW